MRDWRLPFPGDIAEGAWLTVTALIGWASHRLHQLSDEGNDHASGHPGP